MTDTATTRLRQSHKKSRKGCRECKKRHVKCDERYPTCGGCAVTNRRCSYLDLHSVRLPPAQHPQAPSPASSLSNGHEGELSHPPTKPARVAPVAAVEHAASRNNGDSNAVVRPQDTPPASCFDMRHLVLLHHLESRFTNTAGPSESWLGVAGAKDCAEAIFQSAVAAPYLMHEMLAFSALHLSTLQVDGDARKADYLRLAAELQTQGLALYNALKPEVRNENCMALFTFASVVGMHALFDAAAIYVDFADLLNNFTSYLKLHRGVSAITHQSWHTLRSSEIGFIIDPIEAGDELYRQQLETADNECNKLMSLVRMSSDKLGPGPYKACMEAVQVLHWVFGIRRVITELHPTHITLAWPTRISADFVELLEQRQPISLIIVAYWAVLLHADRNFWVFGDTGRHMIELILPYLGSYWDEWLDIPRRALEI